MPFRPVGIALSAIVLAGCGGTVSGHPQASQGLITAVQTDSGLARLLPDSSQFPARYAAVTLPVDAAGQAASDLDGVLPGAMIDPATCAPQAPTAGPVVVVGTDDAARATLTVELVRTDQKLSVLRDQLQRCGTVRVGHGGTTATITTEMDPPPPLDADDTLALRRSVRSENGSAGMTRNMQTLLGQIGDVRINVTYMSFTDAKADAQALDSLFTTAVGKVRKG
ncbi:sensor domain-containing protein [Nocardia sp. NPDC056100]|uniref:sensor domain-containing protein n=1 Tax=Nocardia sp. NPDC056100 TaxID=3345712 RepID=UPI0035D920AC